MPSTNFRGDRWACLGLAIVVVVVMYLEFGDRRAPITDDPGLGLLLAVGMGRSMRCRFISHALPRS